MMRLFTSLYFLFLLNCVLLVFALECAYADPRWNRLEACGIASRSHTPYCLEILELTSTTPKSNQNAILLIPGFFQNGFIFDLLPQKGISFAQELQKQSGSDIYLLHVRGIGNSTYVPQSKLDDIATDDIPLALNYLFERAKKPVYIIGHSQGAITLQASLAGLKWCGQITCFDQLVSVERQKRVQAAVLYAGNVAMTTLSPENKLKVLSKLGVQTLGVLNRQIDLISAKILTRLISPTDVHPVWWSLGFLNWPLHVFFSGPRSLAYADLWEFLYHLPNVSTESRQALYNRSLDHSSLGIINQFAEAVTNGGMQNTAGEKYADSLKNILTPTVQIVFDLDPMAEPEPTFRDSFSKIGSVNKKFEIFKNQGHEDFLMEASLMQRQIDFLKTNLLSSKKNLSHKIL